MGLLWCDDTETASRVGRDAVRSGSGWQATVIPHATGGRLGPAKAGALNAKLWRFFEARDDRKG